MHKGKKSPTLYCMSDCDSPTFSHWTPYPHLPTVCKESLTLYCMEDCDSPTFSHWIPLPHLPTVGKESPTLYCLANCDSPTFPHWTSHPHLPTVCTRARKAQHCTAWRTVTHLPSLTEHPNHTYLQYAQGQGKPNTVLHGGLWLTYLLSLNTLTTLKGPHPHHPCGKQGTSSKQLLIAVKNTSGKKFRDIFITINNKGKFHVSYKTTVKGTSYTPITIPDFLVLIAKVTINNKGKFHVSYKTTVKGTSHRPITIPDLLVLIAKVTATNPSVKIIQRYLHNN